MIYLYPESVNKLEAFSNEGPSNKDFKVTALDVENVGSVGFEFIKFVNEPASIAELVCSE